MVGSSRFEGTVYLDDGTEVPREIEIWAVANEQLFDWLVAQGGMP